METFGIRCPFNYGEEIVEDDDLAGASVVFVAIDGHKPFLLSFANVRERHRMFRCLAEAHAGSLSQWRR